MFFAIRVESPMKLHSKGRLLVLPTIIRVYLEGSGKHSSLVCYGCKMLYSSDLPDLSSIIKLKLRKTFLSLFNEQIHRSLFSFKKRKINFFCKKIDKNICFRYCQSIPQFGILSKSPNVKTFSSGNYYYNPVSYFILFYPSLIFVDKAKILP
jgi:hypothetical protein